MASELSPQILQHTLLFVLWSETYLDILFIILLFLSLSTICSFYEGALVGRCRCLGLSFSNIYRPIYSSPFLVRKLFSLSFSLFNHLSFILSFPPSICVWVGGKMMRGSLLTSSDIAPYRPSEPQWIIRWINGKKSRGSPLDTAACRHNSIPPPKKEREGRKEGLIKVSVVKLCFASSQVTRENVLTWRGWGWCRCIRMQACFCKQNETKNASACLHRYAPPGFFRMLHVSLSFTSSSDFCFLLSIFWFFPSFTKLWK